MKQLYSGQLLVQVVTEDPRVLIVERSSSSLALLEAAALPFGRIETARDVPQALELLAQNKFAAGIFGMELGFFNAENLIAALRSSRHYKHLPIAVVSADEDLALRFSMGRPNTIIKRDAQLPQSIESFLRDSLPCSIEVQDDALAGLRILLADDTSVSRMLYRRLLEGSGAEVTDCEDGAEALALLRTDDFDLVILDVEMPNMDGEDLVRQLRAEGRDQLVFALTGKEKDAERALAFGFDSTIDMGQDLQTVRQLILDALVRS